MGRSFAHLLLAGACAAALAAQTPPVSTFSIVAYDPIERDWGVAVASRYFSVGSVVPWAEAGVGAVATQANVNVGYGPRGLELLRQGLGAKQVIDRLLAEDRYEGKEGRQVAVVDAKGAVAAYTGPKATAWAGDRQGRFWSAQGNILTGAQVVEAMGRAFEAASGELAERLYAALKAGDEAGGDARGRQSASLLLVRKDGGRHAGNDRPIYINVDDHPQPIPELRRLLDINQTLLYQDRTFKLLNAGKLKEARNAAGKAAVYSPNNAGAHLTFGLLSYATGDKPAALEAFRKANGLDPNFRRRLEAAARTRPEYRAILEDKTFLDEMFGAQGR